ncbi:MAG: hypothetical protein U9R79_07680 [Armatimonadota bacterium]|nr:hypothetical protein [Armatimonadota bacterium]
MRVTSTDALRNTPDSEEIHDPLLAKAASKTEDGRPRGIPHRIIPSLLALGTYKGIQDPQKATGLTFNVLRMMSNTHLVRTVINHRVRSAKRFGRLARDRGDFGFRIELRDPDQRMTAADRKEAQAIGELIERGGYLYRRVTDGQIARWDGRGEEQALRFDQLLGMLVEDSLVYDAAAFRLEIPRDPRSHPAYKANPDALGHGTPYPPVFIAPVDGSRIRKAEMTYRPPKTGERRAITPVPSLEDMSYEAEIRPELGQHVAWVELDERNEVQREFAWHELAYLARNPASDIWTSGYGRSELEYLIEIVTGIASGVGFNVEFFTHSHIPTGVLALAGEWGEERIKQFHSDLITQVGGPGKWHKLPILWSSDPQAVAQFLNLRHDERLDMYWEKWLAFLTTLICALYGMAPEEIWFQSFRQTGNALQEADPSTRITHGQDTGFIPLMTHVETIINEHIVWRIDDRWAFRWQNLRERDEEVELRRLQMEMSMGLVSVNTALKERDRPEIKDPVDLELYRMVEKKVEQQWPATKADPIERQRVTRQLYEAQGGTYARWPDAPGMPAIISQLYMQEIGQQVGGGQEPFGGMLPGGLEPEGGTAGPLGLGSPQRAEEAPNVGGAASSPSSSEDVDDLLTAFLPPMQKSVTDEERVGVLQRALHTVERWAEVLRGGIGRLMGGGADG